MKNLRGEADCAWVEDKIMGGDCSGLCKGGSTRAVVMRRQYDS